MAAEVELEVQQGQRPFPQTQELFAGPPISRVSNMVDVGWYDRSVDPRSPGFCVASLDEHEDLVGEILRITHRDRSVYVYCLGQRDIPTPLAVTRRAFFPQLGLLAESSVSCVVEVVQ